MGVARHNAARREREWGDMPEQITLDDVRRELEAATQVLRDQGGFDWLMSGRQTFNVAAIREGFTQRGMPAPSPDAVQRWLKTLPRTEYYNSRIGAWGHRDDLVVFFARRIGHGGLEAAD